MKVLSVGARTEAEILSLAACGFHFSNIFAIDLFSYSPTVVVADAVQLPFRADSFDVVVIGWVLEFIPNFAAALGEAVRVTREGGLLAVGAMHHPESTDLEGYYDSRGFTGRTWKPQDVEAIESAILGCGVREIERVFGADVVDADRDKRADLVALVRIFK